MFYISKHARANINKSNNHVSSLCTDVPLPQKKSGEEIFSAGGGTSVHRLPCLHLTQVYIATKSLNGVKRRDKMLGLNFFKARKDFEGFKTAFFHLP